MDEDETIDPKPTADRMIAEIQRSGTATQECVTQTHARDVAYELEAQGYTAVATGRFVSAH